MRILEKTTEATYHSICNENPECSIKLRKFGELHPWNVRLKKMCCSECWLPSKGCNEILPNHWTGLNNYHTIKSFVITFSVKNQTSNTTTENALTAKQSPWHGLKIWNAAIIAMWKMLIVICRIVLSVWSNLNELTIFMLVNQRRS